MYYPQSIYYLNQTIVSTEGPNPLEGTIYQAGSTVPANTLMLGGEIHKNSTVGSAGIFVGVTVGAPDTSGFWTSRWNTGCKPKKWECDLPINVQFGDNCIFENCNFVNGAEGIQFGANCIFKNCTGVPDGPPPHPPQGLADSTTITTSGCDGQVAIFNRAENNWCKNVQPRVNAPEWFIPPTP